VTLAAGRFARVRVPATSANLGPGFDAFGLALDLWDDVEATVTDEPGWTVTVEGEGAGSVPTDHTHLVAVAMQRGFADAGVSANGVKLHCRNVIPHGRGLGSSAAAIVAGLSLARGLSGAQWTDEHLLALADEMEGHPDNVAACIFGGFTMSWTGVDGVHAISPAVHESVTAVAVIPNEPVSTHVARGLLPERVPHVDAAFNAGRAALLVAAIGSRPEYLLDATADRLHQDYRSSAFPQSSALVQTLRERGIAAVISGAGPTVLALGAPVRAADIAEFAPSGMRVVELAVVTQGAQLTDTK